MQLWLTLGTTTHPLEFEIQLSEGEYAEYIGLELLSLTDELGEALIPPKRVSILRIPFTPGGINENTFQELHARIAYLEAENNDLQSQLDES